MLTVSIKNSLNGRLPPAVEEASFRGLFLGMDKVMALKQYGFRLRSLEKLHSHEQPCDSVGLVLEVVKSRDG